MTCRSKSTRAAWLIALALAAPRVAYADERTEARRHFRAGIQYVEERQYDRAITEFQEAYRILPNVNVLYNIGRAYLDAGDADRAIEYFQRYLANDVADRAEVEEIVRELEQQRRTVRARATPPSTTEPVTPVTPVTPNVPVAPPGTLTPDQLRALRKAAETLLRFTEGTPAQPAGPITPPTPVETPSRPSVSATHERVSNSEDTYEERVVTATLSAQSPLDAPNATSVITAQDIRLSGITQIPELLRRAVGMDVMELEPGDGLVSIRGFNRRLSNKVLILVDGRSVFLDFLGITLWPSIPVSVEEIERIEIIRGPGSALYGADAYTGVINIITRAPGEPRNVISAGVGNAQQLRGMYMTSGRAGGIAYRASTSYEQAVGFSRLVDPSDMTYRVSAPDPDIALRDVRFDLDLRSQLSRTTSIRGGVGGSHTYAWFSAIGPLRRFWTDLTFVQPFVEVRSGGLMARAFLNHAQAYAGEYLQPVGASALDNQLYQEVFDLEVQYATDHQFSRALRNTLTLGASYRMKYISWSFLDGDHRLDHFAGYVQDQLRITDRLTALVSFRLDRHPVLDAPVFSPRGAIIFKPSARRAIRLSGGTAFRTPTFLELYLDLQNPTLVPGVVVRGQGGEVFNGGQQRLRPENAISVDLGYQDQTSDRFQYEANLFFTRGTDLIDLTTVFFDRLPGQPVSPGAIDVGRFRFANDPFATYVYGAEAGVRVSPIEGLDVYANYTYADTRHEQGAVLAGGNGLPADQRTSQHKFNAGFQLRTRFGLDAELDVHYASSQVWLEQVFDAEHGGVRYEAFELPNYVLLNGRVGTRLLNDRLEVGVVGLNLTDNRIRQHPFGSLLGARVMGVLTYRY